MDRKHPFKSPNGPKLRLVVNDERLESESESASFEELIAEIKGKSKSFADTSADPAPRSQLAKRMTNFADELDKRIADLLAL